MCLNKVRDLDELSKVARRAVMEALEVANTNVSIGLMYKRHIMGNVPGPGSRGYWWTQGRGTERVLVLHICLRFIVFGGAIYVH